MPPTRHKRRAFLVAGSAVITTIAGCTTGSDDASTYETSLSVITQGTDDVDVFVSVYNETTDEVLVEENGTVPADNRFETSFTVELDEPGGSARVSATLENIESGDEDSEESVFGSTGALGFSGTIDDEGGVSLSTLKQ